MKTADISTQIISMAQRTKQASRVLRSMSAELKNTLLLETAEALLAGREMIQQENNLDMAAAQERGMGSAMLSRLHLSDAVIQEMVTGLREVATLSDPVGEIENLRRRPSGILVGRMRIPLGVICMIYESRPNVTIDAAALCLKSGNAVILRGGSEALRSNLALAAVFHEVLKRHRINPDIIQVVPTTDRSAIDVLLQQEESIDLVIPRGGEGLIRAVTAKSRIPVLKHYKGVCHAYIDVNADMEMAQGIVLNAKIQRPSACNALEGMLVHQAIAGEFLPRAAMALHREGVRLLGCVRSQEISTLIEAAEEEDWGREFLDLTMVVRIVDSLDEALEYIECHGSRHTETILTRSYANSQRFLQEVDASAVMINASTRFNDGGQFGLGMEIGISTSKLHAYGPMGLNELTTRKFVVLGNGEVRA
ncbi:MAG: glutamate-5-semialdehyde dehydrogenase [bacterium]|nr:glutamate-5-semialdehyde dehydrogenase [bacterium]